MPVNFLSEDQKASYGNYHGELTKETLARYFHLDDFDRMNISEKRGDQLHIENGSEQVNLYNSGKQRRQHIVEITKIYGYTEFTDPRVVFSLTRWLYSLCWIGTSRSGIFFERCTGWLLSHKVLLPGYSLLERYIARLRNRVENRLWHSLAACIDDSQTQQLLNLLSVPAGSRYSLLDQLRTGPTKVNATSLVQAIGRLQAIRNLGVTLPAITPVSDTRIAAMARYASTAKITALQRLPEKKKTGYACCILLLHGGDSSG